METKNQIFNPFDLIQRTEPQKKRDYIVKIIPEQPVDILTEEQETTEVLIKDKRKNSMNLVERSLILNRIRAAIPVEQSMLSKSPVTLSQPINETELDTISDTIENEKNYEIVEKKIQDAIQETPMEKSKTLDEDALMDLEILQDAEPSEPMEAVKQPTKKTTAKKRPVKDVAEKDVAEKEKRTGAPLAVTAARQKLTMGVSSYYMNNRKLFIQQLSKLFKPYHDKIAEKGQEITCKTAQKSSIDFDLLTHQLVVRDYLNLYTPYRGLLLYHGLGSGKTCTSIGIAEGMKSDKKLILMTPASLKMNFFSELKKCGDVLFRKNNFWEFISIEGEPDNKKMLSDTLGIPKEYVQEKKGAWMADIKKEPNFANLSDNDQKNIDEQLNLMIRNKYQDINYNGLTKNKMEEFTNHGKTNPFHHSVVIIEEAHNLVSRIANSLKKKKSIAYQLYQLLMDATDVKVIFLTGTPIINHPREIGILFNMLRGFIKTWTFQIQTTTTEKLNRDILLDYFKKENFALYDYVEYSGDKLVITRNPFGFVNMYKKRIGGGHPEIDGGANGGANGGAKKHTGTRKRREKREPSANYTRKSSLADDTDDTDDIADEEIVDIEHQYDELNKNLYEGGASGGGTGGASGAFEEYSGVRLDEMGNVSDAKFQSKITDILQKYNINIVGKPKVVKELCLPDDENLFKELFINNQKGELSNVDLLKRRILGLTSYFRSAQEQLLPRFVKNEKGGNYHLVEVNMSQHQFDIYSERRKEERDDEKRQRKGKKQAKDDDDSAFVSTYRIYSRSACNFAFPSEYPRPMIRTEEVKTLEDFDGIEKEVLQNKDDYFEEEQVAVTTETTTLSDFQTRVKETYDALATKDFLKKRELHKYSPKFLQILESIQDEKNKGLHLLYSQFRTLEGIGIFKLVLESNGFTEFKITKKTGKWTIENADVDPEKPRFVLYTGTETAEEKEIIRNIYNSAWEFVPPSILETLRTKHENNFYGEVIKVLMITSSGAEGINLRNTRFVHIVEPYWNMVRIDQVVGRARRICSHEDLPDNLRTVQVFVYISKMTNEQLVKNIEMKTQDTSKLEYPVKKDGGVIKMERVPFSTDQYLFEIAQIKDSINTKILTAVKETAIDCSLYNTNPEEPLVCYGFGKVASNNFGSYPVLETDLSEKTEANVKTEKTVLVAVTVDGVKYAMDKKTRTVYDFESYKKAKEKRGELIKVGTLDMRTQTIIP
jgi:hypothetical protein